MEATAERVAPRDLPDHLMSHGIYVFTPGDVERLCHVEYADALVVVHRLKARGKVFSPARGLYVAIPPEYRSWRGVPADWFIDPMMKHMGRSYYVSLLSAAAMHGAAHQAPMVYQVMTGGYVKNRIVGRVPLRFFDTARVLQSATQQFTVHTGFLRVATKETTVVDLVMHFDQSGGISNVATVLADIGALNGALLALASAPHGRAIIRRVGWLAQHFGNVDDLAAVRHAARTDVGEPVELYPGGRRRGVADKEWAVRLNVEVEPDG